jgi:hypothetical protein
LSRKLIDQQVVTEDEFVALSRARVDVVRAGMIVVNAALAERIRAVQLKVVEADDDSVRMDVTLKAVS